jgi:hypothetical protein
MQVSSAGNLEIFRRVESGRQIMSLEIGTPLRLGIRLRQIVRPTPRPEDGATRPQLRGRGPPVILLPRIPRTP